MVYLCLHAINSNYICIVELLLQKNKKLENRCSLFCQTINEKDSIFNHSDIYDNVHRRFLHAE